MKKALLLSILIFLSAKIVHGQPAGWQYAMPITVTENSGNTLYNYQLDVTINTQALITAGQMDANGNDIRFQSSCAGTFLNYWIESGINSPTTLIWVRIDTLPAGSAKTILMFYGNPSAPTASSLATFNGPYSATDSVNITNAGGVGDSQRGFRFAPTEDILVTSFGKNEPDGSTRFVTLFDFNTQAIVRQMQVSGPVGIYSYTSLSSPVWLTQGTQYLLELFQGTSDGYYFQSSSQVGQHLTYFDMRYCNTCTQNTFPTSILTNFHYGLPDFWYYTKSNATPPPTHSLGSAYQLASLSAGNDTSLCESTPVQIGNPATNGYPPFSYLWNPSVSLSSTSIASPVATPVATTTYTETATDSFGCAVSDIVTLTVFPYTPISFSIGVDSICLPAQSQPLALSASPAGGAFNGTGVFADTLYPDSAGFGMHTISYSYTDSIGCIHSSVDSIFIDICVGVQDLLSGNDFKIYPNPVRDELRIQNAELRIEKVELYNPVGEKISSYQPNTQRHQWVINVLYLKPGIYFVKMQTPDGIITRKFVKE